jgi:co-chaperonin GroES (HSP10)
MTSFTENHAWTPEQVNQAQSDERPVLLPLNGRIVVEAISEEKTPSGLYLPSNTASEQRATIGKVIALPPGYSDDEAEVEASKEKYDDYYLRIGDVVLFGQNSGMLMDVGVGAARRRAIILRESEVLCKVRKADGSPYA